MRQGDGGRFVQRLGGREIRLEKLEGLREAAEHAIDVMTSRGFSSHAVKLRAALDDVFPPSPPQEV